MTREHPVTYGMNGGELSEPGPAPVTRQRRRRMEAGQLWRQYVIGGIANIAAATTGYSMGWTSPISLKLKDIYLTDSPLPAVITTDQESLIGSLFTIGAIFGPFMAGFLSTRIGRKWALLVSSVPLLVGYILITGASNVGFLYAGRIFWGFSAGMIYTVSPMYCAEIATNDARGALGSYLQIFVVLGFLLIYCIGPFVSYNVIAYVGIAVLVVFDITFFFMPETPLYHLTKDNREAAARSLMSLRGRTRAGVEAELDVLASDVAASMTNSATIKDVFRGSNFKALYISCALVFFQQFCGITAVLFYLTNIFEAAGSKLDSSVATIIVGFVQVIASCVTPFVVDRLGRRLLLMFSACGTALGHMALGIFFLLQVQGNPIVESIGFLPILSMVVFIITYCVGLGPITWAVIGELFPIEVKGLSSPIVTATCWTMCFSVTRYFGPISEALGMYVAFWIFGACCVGAFFFTLFLVPETKGKSFAEIQDMLAGKSSKNKMHETQSSFPLTKLA